MHTNMHIWQPEPGETLLARTPVTFASGAAMRVRGMRWFRDTERNDIQSELSGWPEGPVYTARSTGSSIARNTVKGAAIALGAVIMGVLTSQGGSFGGGSSGSGSDTSHDRADEIEDFPVMWAAPGAIARTLPWQLDPGRSDEHYRTHAIVTDRRLIIVGLPYYKKDDKVIEDEVLWEIARSQIRQVEPKDFKHGRDVKVVFTDGSWCRLWAITREKLTRHLLHPLALIPLEALTPAQRNTVENFVATAHAPDVGTPFVTRRPCGHYRIDVPVPSELDSFFGANYRHMRMNPDGTEVAITDYHPEDF